jgi:hypothetical protein
MPSSNTAKDQILLVLVNYAHLSPAPDCARKEEGQLTSSSTALSAGLTEIAQTSPLDDAVVAM